MTTTTKTKSLRAVLYGRVSSMRQGGGDTKSVDDQLSSLRGWAVREGHQVVDALRDDGISASRYARKSNRPGWQTAMELISSGLVDVLAVWAITRATRDRAVWTALVAACIDHGVLLAVDGKLHDPADPDDGFMLDISAALAIQGSARISKDTKRSVDSRASRGAPHGRVPDGYAIEYDQSTGKPLRRVIDPVRGPLIREIATRLLAGESARSIARDFNARGLTSATGKPWDGSNITKRIQSPSLCGLRVHHGEVMEGVTAEWPPLLSVEEHHRLMALLNDPARKLNKQGTTTKHLGTGIYTCGVCGAPVRMISGYRPDGSRRVRYSCSKGHCVMRGQAQVDELVERVVVRFLSRPDVLEELSVDQVDTEVAEAQEEAARLRTQLSDLRSKVDAGLLGLDDLVHFRAVWEPKLKAAEERARPKHLPTLIYDVAGPEAQTRWDATSVLGKRTILKALFTVTINRQGGRGSTFDPDAIVVQRKR